MATTPEGKIQAEICKYLRSKGAFFWRQNNAPVFDKKLNGGRGGYRGMGTYAMRGVGDILCVDAYGGLVAIECKSKRGKLSPDQILFKKRCERHNAMYIVATSVDDVKEANITWG